MEKRVVEAFRDSEQVIDLFLHEIRVAHKSVSLVQYGGDKMSVCVSPVEHCWNSNGVAGILTETINISLVLVISCFIHSLLPELPLNLAQRLHGSSSSSENSARPAVPSLPEEIVS